MGVAARLPEYVRGVYSEDAAPMIYSGEGVPAALLRLFGLLSNALERSHHENWSLPQFAAGLASAAAPWAASDPAGLVDFAQIAFGTDPAVLRASMKGNSWASAAEVSTIELGIRCPLHIAQADGTVGGIVTDAHLQHLRDVEVNLTSTYFPGAGHMITATQLKLFLADLARL